MPAKYYRTVVQVEILSDQPIADYVDFDNLSECVDGDWSGDLKVVSADEVSEEMMAELLIAQGSDPGFLGIVDDGPDA